jgi:hypothetical protein
MATAATVETEPVEAPLTAIPEDQGEPWRPGQQKRGSPSKRFGHQEASDQERQAFMEQTAGFSSDDWQRTLVYVYQWAPSVDLTRGGRDPKYRKIFTRHMSEEDIKRSLGSGTYELKLNQINPQGKEKTINRIVISIMDYDFPPNIPPGPWLDDPKNADWLWAKPLLEAKYKTSSSGNAPTQSVSSGPTWGEMIQFMREERRPDAAPNAKDQLMTSVIGVLPALLQQQNTASDPSKVIEAMVKVKEMMAPPPTKEDNALLTFVLAQLTRLQESNDKLMTLLLTQKATENKAPDPLTQVETMTKIITAVSAFTQPPAPREPWQEVVSELGPKVLQLGENIVGTIGMQNRMRAAPPPPRPVPQTQPAGMQPPPPPVPPAAQVATAPNPEEQPTPQTEGPQMDTMQRTMLVNVAQLASQALNLSLTGDQFAEQVCYKFGQIVYDQFCGSVTQEALLPAFKSIPEAWQFLAPFEPHLPEFIASFYGFAEVPDELPDDAPPVPEVVKPNGKAAKKVRATK